jgi:predicted enzyme related to lactoylglutathione lyase
MADQSVRGQFVWHELMTPDAGKAHAFYAKAIGWKSQPWEEDASYVMFAAQRGPIGATASRVNGDAPHWLPYIGTGNIEKTVKQAQELGGTVVKDIDSISSGSRYAVLKDPFGATFGVYESAEDYGTISPPQPGEHSWHELMTGDFRAAFDFYSSLFGWQKMDEHDMGELGTYMIWGLDGRQLGGMFNAMNGAPPPSWLSYVRVKDVHQTARKVKSAGGQVVNGPMEVPGGDWIVQAVDPQGAMFAAHASAARMLEAPKKKKSKVKAAETPAPTMQDPEESPAEDAPPAEKAPEEAPAKKAPRKKAPAPEAPAKEAPPAEETPAEEAPAKQAPAKKSPAKKSPAKKAPAKKAPASAPAKKKAPPAKKSSKTPAKKKAGKKSSKKKGPASKGAGAKKSAAKKGGKKVKTRSGGSKKAAKKPRKGK